MTWTVIFLPSLLTVKLKSGFPMRAEKYRADFEIGVVKVTVHCDNVEWILLV